MNKSYIVAFTIFSRYYKSGFHTYFKVFDSLKSAINYVKSSASIHDNYCIYESIHVNID